MEELGRCLCMVDCDLESARDHYVEEVHDEDDHHGEGDRHDEDDHGGHVVEEIHDCVHVCGEVCEEVLEDDGLEMNEPYVLCYLMIF